MGLKGTGIFFRNCGRWSSQSCFSCSTAPAALIPEPVPQLLQRQPCLRKSPTRGCPLPSLSPGDVFRDAAQSGTDGEGGGREQLAAPIPSPPAKLECLSPPHSSRHVWEQGGVSAITPMADWQGKGPSVPEAVRVQGREQDPGSATGQMREEHLCRSWRFIINCWRIGEYVWRGKGTNKLIWVTGLWREAGSVALSDNWQGEEWSCGFTFISNAEKSSSVATATSSPSFFVAPASSPFARAAVLYVVSQMRGLDSWGNNSAKVFHFSARLTIWAGLL